MADKNKKTNDFEWQEPLFIIFIFSLPILVAGLPFLMFLQDTAPSSILRVWREYVKPVISLLNALLVAFIFFLVLEIIPLQNRHSFLEFGFKKRHKVATKRDGPDVEILKKWELIMEKADGASPDNMRIAIIEADALVDLFLRKEGYGGESMAERLSQIDADKIKNVDALWDAHRLRNILAHTPGASVRPKEGADALKAFERFLKEMGAI